jgi:hypothetical protein
MPAKDHGGALSVNQAHELLGGKGTISRKAIYAALRRGDVPHFRIGNRILISRAWLEEKLKGK